MVDHRDEGERAIDQTLGELDDWLSSLSLEQWVHNILGEDPAAPFAYSKLNRADALAAHIPYWSGLRRARVVELAAWLRLVGNDSEGARALIDEFPVTHRPSAAFEALLSAREGHARRAIEASRDLEADAPAAARRIASYALGQLGRTTEAIARAGDDDRALFLAVAAAHYRGAFANAAKMGEAGFERFGEARFAYNVACSLARAGEAPVALSWLERAIDAGWTSHESIDEDEDLASVRALDGYARVRARLASPPYR